MPIKVTQIELTLPQYRVAFCQAARKILAERGIDYEYIVGQPTADQAAKADLATLGWERRVDNRYLPVGHTPLVWQPVLREFWQSDLVIVGQQNQRLVNYVGQMLGPLRPARLAFWGHGRNFQARSEASPAERWKRFWASRCDWWFAYTEQSREAVERCGFPPERITVFHNAIDTAQLRRWADDMGEEELAALRRRLEITTDRVAVYVGALYDHKRIDFLIEAAIAVRRRLPDFVLIVVGSGVDRPKVEQAAAAHPWIRYLGPRFGRELAAIFRLGRAAVMPGAIGLGILDGSALGVPMVTTTYPYHGPEFAYLRSGENGLIVGDWQDPQAYADAVTTVLVDSAVHAHLADGARRMAETHTIERMAENFADGVVKAIAAPRCW